jgi:hypothetical protein
MDRHAAHLNMFSRTEGFRVPITGTIEPLLDRTGSIKRNVTRQSSQTRE